MKKEILELPYVKSVISGLSSTVNSLMAADLAEIRKILSDAGYTGHLDVVSALRSADADLKSAMKGADKYVDLQGEIDLALAELKANGHFTEGKSLHVLIDSAIDLERDRHGKTLHKIGLALGQEWAFSPFLMMPGRSYEDCASFLVERIRHDFEPKKTSVEDARGTTHDDLAGGLDLRTFVDNVHAADASFKEAIDDAIAERKRRTSQGMSGFPEEPEDDGAVEIAHVTFIPENCDIVLRLPARVSREAAERAVELIGKDFPDRRVTGISDDIGIIAVERRKIAKQATPPAEDPDFGEI